MQGRSGKREGGTVGPKLNNERASQTQKWNVSKRKKKKTHNEGCSEETVMLNDNV